VSNSSNIKSVDEQDFIELMEFVRTILYSHQGCLVDLEGGDFLCDLAHLYEKMTGRKPPKLVPKYGGPIWPHQE